jgi:hypothetical protein
MCGNSWWDTFPGWLHPLLANPLLTWCALGVIDLAALLLIYASFTRPMSRWCSVVAWLALPVSIGLTMLFLVVVLATSLFNRVY